MRQWPSLVMPMGTASYFAGIESADHRSCGSERDFMLAGAPAEEHADAETFLFGVTDNPVDRTELPADESFSRQSAFQL